MDWPTFIAQWLHVLLGITWFGSAITGNIVFIPALMKLPLDRQREVGGSYGEQASKVIPIAAMGVILLGIIRGTVFGQIKSLDALTTTYGLTWLVALIAASATFAWGKWAIEPAIARMNAIPASEAFQPDGAPSLAMTRAVDAVKRVAALELLGFFVVFTCMILMRFGY
ncbi:MAG TPA: hypothetical protein VGK16_09215 [Candidatus Limnocylindrales bacterium]